MKNLPKILLILASLFLLALFVFPMWKITLIAPQYPDGVTMHIWVNKIGGDSPGTLQNVNILNHYIGMKPIEPDSIAELKYFQYIVLGMVGLGLIFAFINKKWLFFTWILLLVVLGALGMYDFYLWEYDYGHSLDPNAPMQFDDASFQPPLFGRKNIISFVALSYPHIGGYFICLSMILGFSAWWLKRREI